MGLRVAVVGCGYWGSKHSRALHALDEVDHVVHVDPLDERLRALARPFPGAGRFSSLQEALPSVDAIVVATPPATHVPVALCALAAGKHVLVEKPLAVTARGARRLVAAATAADRILMVGHTFEYDPAVRVLRQLVRSGELGEIQHVDSARLNLGLYQPDVNVVMDLAPHDISIMNFVLDRQPAAVEAWACSHADRDVEDVAYLRLHYDGPPLSATVHVSWLDPCKVRRMTLVGSRRMAVYDDLAADRIRVHDAGVDTVEAVGGLRAVSYRRGGVAVPFIGAEEPLAVQDRHFARSVLDGTPPLSCGRSGLAVVEVLEAANRALDERRPVAVAEVRNGDRTAADRHGQGNGLVSHVGRAEP